MTNVEDTACTASYGANANLVSSGGKSIVGYVKQLSEYLVSRVPVSLSYHISTLSKASRGDLCTWRNTSDLRHRGRQFSDNRGM